MLTITQFLYLRKAKIIFLFSDHYLFVYVTIFIVVNLQLGILINVVFYVHSALHASEKIDKKLIQVVILFLLPTTKICTFQKKKKKWKNEI